MPVALRISATGQPARPNDQGLLVISLGFSDHDSEAVTPTAAIWSLTDEHGNVINERLDVAISPLAAAVDIALSGDDLKYSDGAKRIFTLEWTYVSDLGTLSDRDQCEFAIENLVKAKTE
jgi:hypothetical protein